MDTKKERKKLTEQYDKIAKKFKEAKQKKDRKAMKELSDKMRPIGIKLAKLDVIDNAHKMIEKWEKREDPNSPRMIEKWKSTLGISEEAYT